MIVNSDFTSPPGGTEMYRSWPDMDVRPGPPPPSRRVVWLKTAMPPAEWGRYSHAGLPKTRFQEPS